METTTEMSPRPALPGRGQPPRRWTVSVDGGEPIPCDVRATVHDGRAALVLELRATLVEWVGDTVPVRLERPDGRVAEGEGVVTKVETKVEILDQDERTTVILTDGLGPWATMLGAS